LYTAYRIRPVVESTDQDGELYCEAKASLADAESECAEFEAKEVFAGREGKRIIWTIYGVNPEEDGARTEEALTDVLSEQSARDTLEKIIGPFQIDDAGYYSPAQTEAQPSKVRIRWGSGMGGDEKPLQEYEFSTLAELNAFLEGVDEASGWLDYEQIDPEPDGSFPETDDEESDDES